MNIAARHLVMLPRSRETPCSVKSEAESSPIWQSGLGQLHLFTDGAEISIEPTIIERTQLGSCRADLPDGVVSRMTRRPMVMSGGITSLCTWLQLP